MKTPILLAENACDRATAYHMSNKIVRHPDGVFVTWLDCDYQSILAQINPDTGQILNSKILAKGTDNHCGAALTVDKDNCLHALCGAHSLSGFIYRFSKTPSDPSTWSPPEGVGSCPTYPSMVNLEDNRPFIAYRHSSPSGHRWGAFLQSRIEGSWQYPIKLVEATIPGYIYTTNSLVKDSNGHLHLGIEFYKTYRNNCEPAKSVGISHFYSDDSGVTWYHDDGRPISSIPAAIDDTSLIESTPKGNLRVGNLFVLDDNRVAWSVSNTRTGQLKLLLRNGPADWQDIDISDAIKGRDDWHISSIGRISQTATGELVVVATVGPAPEWADPQQQLACLWYDPIKNRVTRTYKVPKADPKKANWLATIEHGHIGKADHPLIVMFTEGNKGIGCVNDAACNVRMLTLTDDLAD